MTRCVLILATMAITTLAACRAKRAEPSVAAGDSAAQATGPLEGPAKTDTASGMPGMPGMQGMIGTGMLDSVQAHMRMMDGMSADQMKATLPTHRQMVANMLAQMNQQMRSMSMPADPAWTATVDSIRKDLVRMPEMSGAELKALVPAHHARVTRLMQMHRQMMGQPGGAKP